MKPEPRSYWMIESPTPDNPMKNQYIITIDSQTIEVYAESIAEALSLSGIPENRIVFALVSVNDHRLNQ